MNKISGILPSNARITSVDVKSERPLRSSTPGFGLPVSKSGFNQNAAPVDVSMDRFDLSEAAQRPMTKEEKASEIAVRMTRDFFNAKSEGDREVIRGDSLNEADFESAQNEEAVAPRELSVRA